MNDKKLAKMIEKYECIYARGSIGFTKDNRKFAWSCVSEEIGVPVQKLQQRWRCIRDRFVREHRKNTTNTCPSTRKRREWPLYESLTYLIPYISAKPPRCASNKPIELQSVVQNESDENLEAQFSEFFQQASEEVYEEILAEQNIEELFKNKNHGGFYQIVVNKLNELPQDEQEECKAVFLDYLNKLTES